MASQAPARQPGRCPEGHELLPWTSPAGICNGCSKRFPDGEQVMDCRQCDWLLCEVCCPRSGARPSLWATLSQLPYYTVARIDQAFDDLDAALESVDTAFEEFAERHAPTFDKIGSIHTSAMQAIDRVAPGASALINPFSDDEPDESPANEAEQLGELFARFCGEYQDSRVRPDADELESLWSRSSVLYACSLDPGPIAAAIAKQLSGGKEEDLPWQPRFRALCALEDFRRRGEVGMTIASLVALRSAQDIRALARVPECRSAALEFPLAVLGEAEAPEQESPPREPTPRQATVGGSEAALVDLLQ